MPFCCTRYHRMYMTIGVYLHHNFDGNTNYANCCIYDSHVTVPVPVPKQWSVWNYIVLSTALTCGAHSIGVELPVLPVQWSDIPKMWK